MVFVSKELSWKRGGAATVCLGLVARRCPLHCQVASVAPVSDAPTMEEKEMEAFVSGIHPSLRECLEHLSPK